MNIRNNIKILALISLISVPIAASSQSMTVIGGGQSARNCYMAATIAAQMHSTSMEEINECTYALQNTSMNSRNRVATFINRGIIYVAMEKYDKAIKDYDRAFKLNPDIAEIHVNRGNMFFMGEVYDQAIAEYSEAIELEFSKEHVAHYNRGLTYEKIGELDKAEADYRRALELLPEWHYAQSKLERILDKTKKNKDS